jgi:hypothetical protein
MSSRMLNGMVAAFIVLIGWLAITNLASAQTASLKNSPADVVKRYLGLDHKGARLDAMSFETVASYTSWHDEPTWGHVVVTRGFVVAEQYRQWEVIDSLEVVIPVTFQVLGSVYMETAGFVQETETEESRQESMEDCRADASSPCGTEADGEFRARSPVKRNRSGKARSSRGVTG